MTNEFRVLAFEGASAYECPLTWAQEWQRLILGDSLFSAPRLNVPLKVEFGTPLAVDAVISALRATVIRHDSLRTLYVDAGDGRRSQRILGAGRATVGLLALDDADDVSDMMEPLIHSIEVPLGPDSLPFAVSVVMQGGMAVAVVGWLQHMAADGLGAMILAEEVGKLAADPAATLPAVWNMRDLVGYECGEQGRRQAAAAAEYRRRQNRLAPARPISRPQQQRSPRYFEMAFNSAAVSAGARILARRYRVTLETVLLAAVTLARASIERQARSMYSVTCANRFKRGMSGMVANLYQDSLLSLDLEYERFSDLVAGAGRAALAANKFGYFDPAGLAAIIEPGASFHHSDRDFGWSLNFRIPPEHRTLELGLAGRDGTSVRDLAGGSRTWMLEGHEARPAQAMFAVWSLGEVASISFTADSARFRPEDVTDLFFAFERAIVEGVEDDITCADLLRLLDHTRTGR